MENKNEDENQLVINDINSSNLGLKQIKTKFPLKKILIITGIILFFIISIVIVIIIITKKSSNNNNDNENEKPVIGRIKCIYDTLYNKGIQILGEEFNKNSDFGIYINGTKMKYLKIYDLSKYETNFIEIRLYSDLNMDYMFKGVSLLKSVEMISLNDTKIISMISTFENCENMEFFSISGFSANDLKSIIKVIYINIFLLILQQTI